MSKKANIALFIPHGGCPHQCSFCNQRLISGHQTPPTPGEVTKILQKAVAGLAPDRQAEIAFFGGSFTALEREEMTALLQAAHPFLQEEQVTGIRVSTRPDAISPEILTILKEYGVTAIELGAQSTNDTVLLKNQRGHTARHITEASRLIHEFGFELGLQMMTGLYGSTLESDRQTAKDLLALKPKTMRIYPTVTFPGTRLYELVQQGAYIPQTLHQTVELCSELLVLFESAGVSVIRLGLHGDSSLEGGVGPCHPALRELCEGELYFQTLCNLLPNEWEQATVLVHPTCLSKMIGQKRNNLIRLEKMGRNCTVVGVDTIPPHSIGITRKENFHVPEILGSTGLQILSR